MVTRLGVWLVATPFAMVAFVAAEVADLPVWATLVVTFIGAMVGSVIGRALIQRLSTRG